MVWFVGDQPCNHNMWVCPCWQEPMAKSKGIHFCRVLDLNHVINKRKQEDERSLFQPFTLNNFTTARKISNLNALHLNYMNIALLPMSAARYLMSQTWIQTFFGICPNLMMTGLIKLLLKLKKIKNRSFFWRIWNLKAHKSKLELFEWGNLFTAHPLTVSIHSFGLIKMFLSKRNY